ncbi:Uncharacterized protein Rs2_40403 [Raphanus sativus]|nr:Uncharacterized protein Rs2_40403 [Raphanus sativus]
MIVSSGGGNPPAFFLSARVASLHTLKLTLHETIFTKVCASEGVQNQIVKYFEDISSVADFCDRVTTSLFREENTGHLKFCRPIFFCINRFQILIWCISNLHTWRCSHRFDKMLVDTASFVGRNVNTFTSSLSGNLLILSISLREQQKKGETQQNAGNA